MARNGNADTKAAFKNFAPFRRCVSHINDEHVETAENVDIIMPMYNWLEYSDNYSDTNGYLWQFKRDAQSMTDARNLNDVTADDSSSFKYKSSILGNLVAAAGASCFRSLEIPLINCKTHFGLNWSKDCVMPNIAGGTTFQIKSTKLHVPIVTLSTKDNVNLTKPLNERFKRSVYWNEYK